MATSNPRQFLDDGGVEEALALEMFLNRVYEKFHTKTLLFNAVIGGEAGVGPDAVPSELVDGHTISAGRSHQFILFADLPEVESHTPGTELLGQNYAFKDGTLTIDDILVSHQDVGIDVQQIAHFEVGQRIATSQGRKLAEDFDKKGFIIATKAANASSVSKDGLTVHNGGNTVTQSASSLSGAYAATKTGAQTFRDDIHHLAQLMDEDNVPEEGRHLVINPYMRRVLMTDTTVFDQQFSSPQENSLNQRRIGMIGGFMLHVSNNLPSTNITSSSLSGDLDSKYIGDFTATGSGDGQPAALALCGADEGRAAMGYVAATNERTGPIYAVRERDERRNTDFYKSQMMVGLGQLFVPCAGAIMVSNS
jgi:hypothetical protein